MRLKLYAGAALVAAVALAACVSNQIGDDNSADNGSVIGPAPVPTPTPTPTPSPKPSATPTPNPSPGTVISSVRVGPYGWDGPAGAVKPPNNQRPYPLCAQCSAEVTATPKDAKGDDIPKEVHGLALVWSVPEGRDVIGVVVSYSNPDGFNVRVTRKQPGEATLRARLRPPGCAEDVPLATEASCDVTGSLDFLVS